MHIYMHTSTLVTRNLGGNATLAVRFMNGVLIRRSIGV